jgi:hypothetical protein
VEHNCRADFQLHYYAGLEVNLRRCSQDPGRVVAQEFASGRVKMDFIDCASGTLLATTDVANPAFSGGLILFLPETGAARRPRGLFRGAL